MKIPYTICKKHNQEFCVDCFDLFLARWLIGFNILVGAMVILQVVRFIEFLLFDILFIIGCGSWVLYRTFWLRR